MKPSREIENKLEHNFMRPISAAVNKLTKIKRNVLPRLHSGNQITSSPIHSNIPNRIKSAHPGSLDKERLYEENINLKNEINKLKKDLNFSKKENYNLEIEMNKREKIIDDLAVDTQNSVEFFTQNKIIIKATESNLILNFKKQFKEFKKEHNKKVEEFENLKKTIKVTKLNEITQENIIFFEEVTKLKSLYEYSLKQNQINEKNNKELILIKENFSKQESVIVSMQENIKNLQNEIAAKEEEIKKVNKLNQDKSNQIVKLKKDLKFQYQINERLINSTNNIKLTSEYISLKTELEKKISEFKKEFIYFKNVAEKKENKVRELESFIKNANNNSNNLNVYGNSSNAYSINYNKEQESINNQSNTTILLLKSKLQEVMKERDGLKKLNQDKMWENSNNKICTCINLAHSQNNLNYDYNHKNADYDYLNDHDLNELIYILIKNFEANKIDSGIIEERVLKDSDSNDIFKILESDEKEYAKVMTNNILNLLKVKSEIDKKSIFSFAKTFIHNNYTTVENAKIEDFKTKFITLFESITFYSSDQKQKYNRQLCKKLTKHKAILYNAIIFYDEDKTGFITFLILRKILEQVKIKLKNSLIEYFIYIMKTFSDDKHSIQDLKYDNLLKLLNEYEGEKVNISNLSNQSNSQDEADATNSEADSAIEITTEEYLNKVKLIIEKVREVLTNSNTKLEDYFTEFILSDIIEFRAIELEKLVLVLSEKFSLNLDQIDVYCLFTKLKHLDDDSVDEIVDFDKFVNAVQYNSDSIKENEASHNDENSIDDNDSDDNEYSKNFNQSQPTVQIPNEDFIQIIKSHLHKNKITFDEFLQSLKDIDNHIQISFSPENLFIKNRYLDINIFENLLLINELIVVLIDPVNNKKLLINKNSFNFKIEDDIVFNNNKINLDYLKHIIESSEAIKGKQFFTYNLNNLEHDNPEESIKQKILKTGSTESLQKLKMELLNEENKPEEKSVSGTE